MSVQEDPGRSVRETQLAVSGLAAAAGLDASDRSQAEDHRQGPAEPSLADGGIREASEVAVKVSLINVYVLKVTRPYIQVQNSRPGRGHRGSDGGSLQSIKTGAGGADPQVGL